MSKNIHDLSDEEFDDLFRNSAEKNDIGFDPEAWNKMSQKLDAASLPPSSPGKGGSPLTKWGLPTIVVLLLLITGTYFLLRKPSGAVTETKRNNKENSVKQKDKVGEKDVATDKVDTENQENAKEIATLSDRVQTDKVVNPVIAENSKKANEVLKSTDNIANKSEKTVTTNAKQSQGNKANVIPGTKSDTQTETIPTQSGTKTKITPLARKSSDSKVSNYKIDKKSSDDLALEDEVNPVITSGRTKAKSQSSVTAEKARDDANGIAKNNKQKASSRVGKNTTAQVTSSKINDTVPTKASDGDLKSAIQNQVLAIDSTNVVEKMQWASVYIIAAKQPIFEVSLKLPDIHYDYYEKLYRNHIACITGVTPTVAKGLSIRLALSPDLSFIPSNKIFKVGNNWAAILEYRFNKRFSIQTGVIRSMKYYGALPSQYEWNAYWTMPSPLKDIDATCKMLDIPLNLRYDIWQKYRSRWFVSGGFTSYIMLKEEYRYNYENPTDPNIKRRSWEGKTGTYPFSVLNLSAGYERQLFRRLTFQAEPFFKAPLGKVGYGKVRLATAGVFFSVKYPF